MDEVIAREKDFIMKALMTEAGMMQSSPYCMARQQFVYHGGADGLPQVYDATKRYDSSLLQQIFLQNYNKKEQQANIRKGISKYRTAYYACDAIDNTIVPSSFHDLKRVCVSDLLKKVNHIHTGCVLLVEVIHVPYRQDPGTMVLVKDANHDIMMVDLYNYVGPAENPKDLFPVGKQFALLNPFLNNAEDNRHQHLMLRCDNPQFVISFWREADSSKSQNPSELRQMGNQHFQKGNLEEASRCYSKALGHVDIDIETFASDKVSCLSNRAEVNLRLERWEEAAKDAFDALAVQRDHAKSRFRMAKAWSRTGKAALSLRCLEKMLEQSRHSSTTTTSDRSAVRVMKDLAKDCRRIAKEERGEYNFPSMMKEACTKPGERLSSFHATFCSSKVATGVPVMLAGDNKKSYRGCKALENLKEGELIMSSKAFAMGRKLPDGGHGFII